MSLQTGASVKLLPRRIAADWMMGGLGIGCAVASAGFAVYMIAVGPGAPDPHGSGYFTVFAHFDRRPQYAALRDEMGVAASQAPARGRGPEGAPATSVAQAGAVDYTATGSIPTAPGATALRPAVASSDEPVLHDFVLRDVFDGKALVEGRHALSLVSPGMTLDGAGEVLSIQRRNDTWVVVTKDGVIGGRVR